MHPNYWNSAVSTADRTKSTSDSLISEDNKQLKQVELLSRIGQEVSGSRDRRLLWMELLSALGQSLDRPANFDPANLPDPIKVPFNERDTIYITRVDSKFFRNLASYESSTQRMYDEDKRTRLELLGLLKDLPAATVEDEQEWTPSSSGSFASDPVSTTTDAGDAGWVFEVDGYHFHNDDRQGTRGYRATGAERQGFVLKRWVHRLETGSAKLPVINDQGEIETIEFTYEELGISRPFIVADGNFLPNFTIPNPDYKQPELGTTGTVGPRPVGGNLFGSGMGASGTSGSPPRLDAAREIDPNNPEVFAAPKYTFKLQFVWREQPLTTRLEKRRKAAEEAAAREAEQAEMSGEDLVANRP